MPAERPSWPAYLVRYAVFLALVGYAGDYAWLAVTPGFRPWVTRLAALLVVAVVLQHGLLVLRQRHHGRNNAVADRNRQPVDVTGDLLRKLLEELRYSQRSDRYFKEVLWPRLQRLERQLNGTAGALSRPAPGRLGRGPSLAALRTLLHDIESRRWN